MAALVYFERFMSCQECGTPYEKAFDPWSIFSVNPDKVCGGCKSKAILQRQLEEANKDDPLFMAGRRIVIDGIRTGSFATLEADYLALGGRAQDAEERDRHNGGRADGAGGASLQSS